jgi:hypothetical protein
MNIKNVFKIKSALSVKMFVFILAFTIISVPFFVGAFGEGTATTVTFHGLVPDCNTGPLNAKGMYANPCDFEDAMIMINKIINFLLFVIATPFVALCIAWAGWLMISSGGSSEKVTKAKHIATNLVIGYVIALAAWLIVKTILVSLGFNGPMFLK